MSRTVRLLAVSLLFASASLSAQSGVPTPESVIGFKPGADFKLTTYDDTIKYFRALDAASAKMQLVPMGTSTQGRTYYVALISTERNLARVDRYREIARRLASPEGLTEDQARALAREGKAIVHIDGGLHSTEVAGPQHTLQLAYDLLTSHPNEPGRDEQVQRILDNVVLMLWPTINPDGHQMVAEHYMKNVGTPGVSTTLPVLYQEYVGHDNNRDAYMLNMIESRVMEQAWRQWEPQIVYVHHQTAPFPTRIWLPPFAEPIALHAPFLMSRTVNTIGMAIAQGLEERGQVGATHMGTGFDAWYAGYIDYAPMFKNIASFWTETALANMAAPRDYTIKDIPQAYQDLRPQSLYPSPWAGGHFGLGDSVAYMHTASMSVLDYAATYKDNVLMNRWRSGMAQITQHRASGPSAYVVPKAQRDPVAAVEMLKRIAFGGVRISELTADFTVGDVTYAAGSWVVPTDQEFIALAREVLDVQKYPDIRESPGGAPEQPYDAAGWTLPLSMGVAMQTIGTLDDGKRAELKKALKPLGQVAAPTARTSQYDSVGGADPAPYDSAPGLGFETIPLAAAIVPPAGAITGTGPSLAIDPAQNNAFRAANQAWKSGATVGWAPGAAGASGRYVISGLTPDAQDTMVRTLALRAERVATRATTLRQPRIAMFDPGASMDEGWTRWVLERFEFPFTKLSADEIGAGNLRSRFDAIVVTDEPRGVLVGAGRGGRGGPAGAGGAGGAGRGAGAGATGASALPEGDANRVKAIDEFVRAGGTLVCLNRSSAFAIDQLKLPVRNTLQGLGRQEFFVGGSLVNVEVDPSQPVMAGLQKTTAVFFNSSPAFETLVGFKGTILARYADTGSPLASGYLLGEQHLQGKAAALEVQHGDGRVILFGFRPQWRGQTFGTFKVIFNSLTGAR
ncbi:MAG: hypothetical protein EXQ49_03095 [Acidobacteria bacterium]|nr:hypothetical protein [Acidobacteriota bacterium]